MLCSSENIASACGKCFQSVPIVTILPCWFTSVDVISSTCACPCLTCLTDRDGVVVLRCHRGETSELVKWMEVLLGDAQATGHVADAKYTQSSAGRYHMALLGTKLGHHAVDLQRNAPWLPLVDGSHEHSHAAATRDKGDNTSKSQPRELTLAQLLDSRSNPSQAQIWHVDNSLGGYTVIVALCDVHEGNGPTALQLGSHRTVLYPTCASMWDMWCRPTRMAYSQLSKGDVMVYSSALLHRGESNQSDASRPVFVYRCVPSDIYNLQSSPWSSFEPLYTCITSHVDMNAMFIVYPWQ